MAKRTKAQRDKLLALVEPLAEEPGDHYLVVVEDTPRGSTTRYSVDGAGDPQQIAEAAIIAHDTATDTPVGVRAMVFAADQPEDAYALDPSKALADVRST